MSVIDQTVEEYIRKLDLFPHEIDELIKLIQSDRERIIDSHVTQINHLVTENDRLKTEVRALAGYIQLKDL